MNVCPIFEEPDVVMSVDGVQECRSNSVSLDVYSIKFKDCRNIYPLKIIRPLNKFNIDYKPQLQDILDSLHRCKCALKTVIGDNPKRAILREALNHSSNYACEYCTSKAVQYSNNNPAALKEKKENDLKILKFEKEIRSLTSASGSTVGLKKKEEQIGLLHDFIAEIKKKNAQLLKKQSHPVWPESTAQGELRTFEDTLRIVQLIEDHGRSHLGPDTLKGIVGRSLLLGVENFNFVSDVTVEYMHVACLGVVKRFDNYVYFLITAAAVKKKIRATKSFFQLKNAH